MEISNLTVLIGANSSGKSLLGKLIYFFSESFLKIEIESDEVNSVQQVKQYIKNNFYILFEKDSFTDKRFEIKFETNGYSIKILGIKKELQITLSNKLIVLYAKIDEAFNKQKSNEDDFIISSRLRMSASRLFRRQNIPYRNLFIPDGRSYFIDRSKSADILMSENPDVILNKFGSLYAMLADGKIRKINGEKFDYFITKDANNTLKGKIVRDNRNIFIVSDDGRKVSLTNSSSGQKELYPLLASFDYLYNYRHDFVVIEEPEAHLFPETQGIIAKFIVELSNKETVTKLMRSKTAISKNIQHTFITTHSPYILSQLNSLLEAGRLSEQFKDDAEKLDKIAKIIPREYWLPRKNINVYEMKDGKSHNLIDSDGIIEEEYLDSASDIIIEEIQKLAEIELE